MAQIRIKQVRGEAGRPETQRRILRALGLRGNQSVVVRENTPEVRGMVNKVGHMLAVECLDEKCNE